MVVINSTVQIANARPATQLVNTVMAINIAARKKEGKSRRCAVRQEAQMDANRNRTPTV